MEKGIRMKKAVGRAKGQDATFISRVFRGLDSGMFGVTMSLQGSLLGRIATMLERAFSGAKEMDKGDKSVLIFVKSDELLSKTQRSCCATAHSMEGTEGDAKTVCAVRGNRTCP
jgi:hypothetical protein